MKTKICCICRERYIGYGNNAEPLNTGYCCDECNKEVIIYRIKQLKNTKNG